MHVKIQFSAVHVFYIKFYIVNEILILNSVLISHISFKF